MTKQSSVKLSAISAMLLLAVGLPVASVVGNAPSSHGTASLDAAPSRDSVIELPGETVTSGVVTIPAVDVVASPSRAAKPAKAGLTRCERRPLESVSDGMVTACWTI